MRYVPPAFPIANISIANTHYDLVDRVQILIDLVNSRHVFLLDDISGQFDGTKTLFEMTSEGGHAVYASTAMNVILDLNGTWQEPRTAYNVYKNEITFSQAPLPGTTFHGIVMDVWAGAFSGAGPSDTAFARTAGSADTIGGKSEGQLNVNSAQFVTGTVLNANNANFLNGHAEAALVVATANSVSYFGGQLPSYYTNATNLITGTLPTGRLTGLYANATVNNTTFAYGKTEIQLNVNSALNVSGSVNFANLAYYIVANSGIVSNATGVFVNANSGIVANATGVFVKANSGIIANATGVLVNANTGLVANATGLFVNATYINTISSNLAYFVVANSGIVSNATGVFVNANSGIVANATGVFVKANSGIIANATGVLVNANSGIVANATGVFVNANSGIVANATGVFVKANSGIIANATGVLVNANTGIVANATGVFVNAAYINTIAANSSTFVLANSGIVSNLTGVFVKANSGIVANATGVFVNPNNGIVVNATGVFVNANSGIVANATGVFVNAAYINTIASNSAIFLAGNAVTTNATALVIGTAAGMYANGGKGTNGQILYSNATTPYWGDAPAGLGAHSILSATHSDSNAAVVARGDLIAGVGASAKWTALTIGLAGYALTSNGTDPLWSASVNSALNANNSAYLNTHTEAQLNANSALNANNSAYLNTHTEAQLNANSALTSNSAAYLGSKLEGDLNVNNATTAGTANNTTYAYGKLEGDLNVNSALSSNNSGYLGGKLEGALNVNSALSSNTSNSALHANNSGYLNTHTEGQLNVNSALGANNSGYLNTHTEAQLNVNSALTANQSNSALFANSAAYLGADLPSFYTNASNANTGTLPDARLSANVVRYATAQTQSFVLAAPANANGNITFRALTANDVYNLDERFTDVNYYGFAVEGDGECSISFDANTYIFTLANTSASPWHFLVGGIHYKTTGPRTVTLPGSPPANGTYFVYIDGTTGANANLVVNATSWSLSDADAIIPVAAILWNDSNTPKWFLGDERHTASISRPLHRYLHTTQGAKYVSGGQLTGQTFSSTVNSALTFAVANAVLMDETLTHFVLGVVDGDGATNNYTVFYHANSSAWTWAPSEVPFPYGSGTYIQYDDGTALVNGTNLGWYTSYVALMSFDEGPGGNTGILIFPGRGEYGSEALAEAENPANFDWTGLAVAEMVLIWQCIWTSQVSYDTKGKVQLKNLRRVSVTVSTSSAGTVVTDHNTLTGLQGGGIGEYFHITSAQWANGSLTANVANTANNSTYAYGKTEGNLNVNSALTANQANTSTYPAGLVAAKGDLIIGNATPAWAKLPPGANGYVLTINDNVMTWNAAVAGVSTHTLLQSNVHTDTTNGTVTRGDVITAQGASPTWTRLALGANGEVLMSNGTEALWATPSSNVVADEANNAIHAFGKHEGELNVNSAMTSNNSGYLNGHTEAQLNVNSASTALTANNSTYAYGKLEGDLNVNNAVTANNSAYLNGHTESQLNANSALGANNASYAFGQTESQLDVNSALTANNATYAFGKSEGGLNVNSALTSNTTNSALYANNSTYAYGKTEGNLNVNSALSSNTTNSALYANDASYLGGKPEANLHVNTALTANNSTYAYGKTEGNLNVNAALTANNATYAFGKSEGELSVNLALTANNATYAFGKTEGNLNVNSALVANNATYAFGKSEGELSVNVALTANQANSALTANNATYAFGKSEGELSVNLSLTSNNTLHLQSFDVSTNTPTNAQVLTFSTVANTWYPATPSGGPGADHALLSATHTDANAAAVTRGDIITGIGASPLWTRLALGANSYVLTSNGTEVVWQAPAGGSLPATNTGSLLVGNTANGWNQLAIGANTYVLTSNGTTATWSAPTATSPTLYAAGNSGTAKTLDWNNGSQQYLTMTGNCTLTINNPSDGGRYVLLVNSGAGSFLITWPANIKWGPGGAPLNTQGASKVDMFTAIYANTTNSYYTSYSLGY